MTSTVSVTSHKQRPTFSSFCCC